eukprot:SAG11_NODE_602_length_8251_cov_6.063543_3_plen_196_part_01
MYTCESICTFPFETVREPLPSDVRVQPHDLALALKRLGLSNDHVSVLIKQLDKDAGHVSREGNAVDYHAFFKSICTPVSRSLSHCGRSPAPAPAGCSTSHGGCARASGARGTVRARQAEPQLDSAQLEQSIRPVIQLERSRFARVLAGIASDELQVCSPSAGNRTANSARAGPRSIPRAPPCRGGSRCPRPCCGAA